MKNPIAQWLLALALVAAPLSGCGDDDGTPGTDSGTPPADGGVDSGSPPEDGGGGDEDGGGGDDGGGGEEDGGGGDVDAGPPPAMAIANIEQAEGDGMIMGTATFVQVGTDVTLTVAVTNCPEGTHPLHVHQGDGCANRMRMGAHWDGARGEGIPDLVCAADGTGTTTVTRTAADAMLAWSIGDGTASDVVGHPVVIHGATPDTDPRIGCGVIMEVTP